MLLGVLVFFLDLFYEYNYILLIMLGACDMSINIEGVVVTSPISQYFLTQTLTGAHGWGRYARVVIGLSVHTCI